jgi:hypothetical protein
VSAGIVGRLKHAGNRNGAQPDGYYAICTEAADTIEDLLDELLAQADGSSTIINLLARQNGPVAASVIALITMQEKAAREAIGRVTDQ